MPDSIIIKNACLHNLKHIDLEIPRDRLVVFTGLSGSGKSTLVLDTLYAEGQRQYLESLGMVTDALSKPPLDSISGLSPAISIDQHITNHSPRSTVGTVTEVFTYLRLLYARLGHRTCPQCRANVPPSQNIVTNDDDSNDDSVEADFSVTYPCPTCGAPIPELSMSHFSFNKPAGACPACTGLGVLMQPDISEMLDENRSIPEGAVLAWDDFYIRHYGQVLVAAAQHYGIDFDIHQPVKDFTTQARDLLLYGVNSSQIQAHFPAASIPTTNGQGRFEGIVTNLLRRYNEHAADSAYRQKLGKVMHQSVCPECGGMRLRPESRQVTVAGRNIIEVSQLPLEELKTWLQELEPQLDEEQLIVASPVLQDLSDRLQRLLDVGVGYLTLERSSPTLSMGEAQRLRLAALLGSGLCGVLYVLDEPTIGLHPSDTGRLIRVLKQLRDLGNTVMVIEHDGEVLSQADFVVDVGPGAGRHGGEIVIAGTPQQVAGCPASITGAYLSGRLSMPQSEGRTHTGRELIIRGARAHNLKNIDAHIPLGLLVAVTGPSGSGKSSLLFDILDRAARRRFNGALEEAAEHDSIEGWQHLARVITIDQVAIGRSPRSNAATYTDAFTPIRETFAATAQARSRNLKARHFSFNVPGGRCERCQGAGVLTVEMHFLPDVIVRCPVCRGRRFKKEILAVKYGSGNKSYDIAEVLEMSVSEALPLFAQVPAAASRLQLMEDVGLGYLQLGQPATTLSGGEAQRVKLAKELGRRGQGSTLYLLDEPTTGLHPADTSKLLQVLQRLVQGGNSVIVIEHNLDIIRSADWIIDLGPGGGSAGGEIVAQGTPQQVAQSGSPTGRYLKEVNNLQGHFMN